VRRTTWIAGLLGLVLLTACTYGVAPAAAAPVTTTPASTIPAPTTAQAQDRRVSQTPTCPTLEGCYTYAQMQEFYRQVLGLIGTFSQASFVGLPEPGYGYVASGQLVPVACGGTADGSAFFYCALDDTLYIGQDQLYEFYRGSGDGGAAFGVAHEWGHYLQDRAGVLAAVVATDQVARIQSENQADCIGGAFLGHLRDQGILESDDYDDINAILPMIASAEADVYRDHGTVQERSAAVQYGFTRGLVGCSGYFPDTPIVT
jgi:predicted metalloprotease